MIKTRRELRRCILWRKLGLKKAQHLAAMASIDFRLALAIIPVERH
jgi:hypothetical protein